MNKQKLSVGGSVGHQARTPGILTNESMGSGSGHLRDGLKPLNGVVDYEHEGFDLVRHKAVESAKNLKTTIDANSYEIAAISVGIVSLLGYLAALRWVCDRF